MIHALLNGLALFLYLNCALAQEENLECSEEELALYSKLSVACQLPDCLKEEGHKWLKVVQQEYPDEAKAEIIGVQFAACECSCNAETCEVVLISTSDSLRGSCKRSLLKECSGNDKRLTAKCSALTKDYPAVYDYQQDNDPLGFTRECRSCSTALETLDNADEDDLDDDSDDTDGHSGKVEEINTEREDAEEREVDGGKTAKEERGIDDKVKADAGGSAAFSVAHCLGNYWILAVTMILLTLAVA